MKNVILQRLSLINWKGQKERSIDFSNETSICGANATGKSTMFDAFIWLLFGKDSLDRKDYNIIPIENGKRVDRVDAEVCGVLDVNGEEITLKRVLHQKWVRKRGTAVETYDGCETMFYINNVKCGTAKEYAAKVDSIIDETVFKMITNPSFFLSLKWQDQRSQLFYIAGTISDEQIAASKPEFKALLDSIIGKTLTQYKREISAKKTELNNDLKLIPSRIDQTRKLMPEAKDFDALKAELEAVESEIEGVEKSMTDKSTAIRGQYEEIQKKQGQINDLKTKQQTVVHEAKEKAANDANTQNSKRRETEGKLNEARITLSSVRSSFRTQEQTVSSLKDVISKQDEKVENKRKEWFAEEAKTYDVKEGCLTCPVFGGPCGDPAAKLLHAENQSKAKQSFWDTKQANLDRIKEEGKNLSKVLEERQKELIAAENELADQKIKVANAEKSVKEFEDMLAEMSIVSPAPVIAEELPEWQELDNQIKTIQATIEEVKPVDTSDLKEQKKTFESHRDELKAELSDKERIAKYTQEINDLEKKSDELAQQIADLEKKEFTIMDFTKTKINECESRINNLFSIVKFELFDKTIDGGEFEACIATNKAGVPISSTNTAEKINAGLDIINALCRFHNVTAPIFIDGRESVNQLIPTESQIINLIVSNDKSLTIK